MVKGSFGWGGLLQYHLKQKWHYAQKVHLEERTLSTDIHIQYLTKAKVPGLSSSMFWSKWMTQETRPTQWGFEPTTSKSERNLKPLLLFYSFDIDRKCVVSKFYVLQNKQIRICNYKDIRLIFRDLVILQLHFNSFDFEYHSLSQPAFVDLLCKFISFCSIIISGFSIGPFLYYSICLQEIVIVKMVLLPPNLFRIDFSWKKCSF